MGPGKHTQEFFTKQHEGGWALTFDDVLLRSNETTILPPQVRVDTRFTRNVPLLTPVVSAAMDTVTEAPMAIAMAQFGGIGVIHRGGRMDPVTQAKEVARVKYHEQGLIDNPIIIKPTQTVRKVLEYRKEKKFLFDSFPVEEDDGRVVGLMTHTDFKRCEDLSLPVAQVMTPLSQLITALPGTSRQEAYELLKKHEFNVLLLVDQDGRRRGMYTYTDLRRILTEKSNHNTDKEGRLRVAAAVGVLDEALERAELLNKHGCDVFAIDTAHAFSKNVLETIRLLKKAYPAVDIYAGNVSEGDAALALVSAGASGVGVGQGGGSICTTRVVTGVGRPQLSAVFDCATALSDSGVPVCADGGIRSSGDIAQALAAGGWSVMVGSFIAATDETPGDYITRDGIRYKIYRGMGSQEAFEEGAAKGRYAKTSGTYVPEGITGLKPARGSVHALLEQAVGGLQKGMSEVGAETIPEFQDTARFQRVTQSGVRESHPHDIFYIQDAPNYRRQS